MFTGIIQSVGKIAAIEQKGGDARLRVGELLRASHGVLGARAALGDTRLA